MFSIFNKQESKNVFFIILGSLCLALGVVQFLLPNNIITGGTAGLALLLHHISSLTIGSIMVLINIPLLLLALKYLGRAFAIRTIITIVLSSFCIDVFAEIIKIKAFTQDPILASIFGGIFIGLGLGLIMKSQSSAGGSTIVAKIISLKTEIKAAKVILIIDALIILSSILIFDDITKSLYSIVSIYATSRVIDILLSGAPSKKVVHLVTNNVEAISKAIKERLGPYGTILNGIGLNDENKNIIMLVVEVNKLHILREIMRANDKDSFIVISEASEMLGRE